MKTLLLYMSTHGTTQEIAEYIGEKMENCTVFDMHHNKPPKVEDYDTVIIGASIHGGDIQSVIKKYMKRKEETLLRMNLGLFLCFMDFKNAKKEFLDVFPPRLVKHAFARGLFGGEFKMEKMDFFEKSIIQKVAHRKKSVSKILWQNVNEFIEEMKQLEPA